MREKEESMYNFAVQRFRVQKFRGSEFSASEFSIASGPSWISHQATY